LYLFHETFNSAESTMTSLNDFLSMDNSKLPRLNYSQKVKIAYTLSSNLLPLLSTPWLENVLKLRQIGFFGTKASSEEWIYHLDCPYLAKGLPKSPDTTRLTCGHGHLLPSSKYKPLTILSLACLLIQINLCHSIEGFDVAERSCVEYLMTQQAAASRKVGTVLAKSGEIYLDAVEWCLKNYLSAVSLDAGEFSQEYYFAVVAKLEMLMDITGSGPSS
jgi:hypothetical protein